ncbi:MAG TPA: hypothetical protein ENI98_10100 [Gammaproteobacteria bacterium]|nr:hypothetical protein [Gammaproteobacteria bacterium]
MSSTIKRSILGGALLALLSACQGTYLGGLLIVDTHDASQPNPQLRTKNQRPAPWGECNSWRRLAMTTDNDVDTTYNKLIRSGLVNDLSVPQTDNATINRNINQTWARPDERPHLMYVMPPRWMVVRVKDFEQTGVVSFGISKNNRGNRPGSFVDIEYCEGGKYDIGFYVPDYMKTKFEHNLKALFRQALT